MLCYCVKLKYIISNAAIRIRGFQSFSAVRQKNGGGGLYIGIRHGLCESVMTDSGRNAEFITMRINCRDRGLRVILVYGPQEYDSEENRNDFYDSISVETERCYLNGDSFILAGDFNAKLGSDIIKYDIHPKSQNGGQLYRLILKHNLCLLNSSDVCHGLFTFVRDSNGKKELSVIDYIFVSPDLNQCCKSMTIDEQRLFTPWRKLKFKRISGTQIIMLSSFSLTYG